jgi:Icc-related predicted phosphoesterase
MARVCIISDTHRKHRQVSIPPCDVLIHCGDIGNFGREEAETFADADAWFNEVPAAHVIVVGGNHDFALEEKTASFTRAIHLEDAMVEVAGLRIYGAPWCPGLNGFAHAMSGPRLAERWRRIPRGLDILVTHTPPMGILDVPSGGGDGLGCPLLRRELPRIAPRLHVFGHIHESHGAVSLDGTEFINAAIVNGRALDVRNAPTLRTLAPVAPPPARPVRARRKRR